MTTTMIDKTFLTREEVAELLRVRVGTVGTWMRRGQLPRPTRVGRRLLWRAATLERFLKRKCMTD